jgi:hypothetical protein
LASLDEEVTESGEGVMNRLVVNSSVQVLDDKIALASLTEDEATLRPHDMSRLAIDDGVVELTSCAA